MGLLKRGRRFQLTGLVASPDGLYDGSFIVSCARWWHHEFEANRKLLSAGYRPLSNDEISHLCTLPQPENRKVFEGVASDLSLPGRHSAAVLSLAYAFAVVIEAAATQVTDEDFSVAAWERARPFTGEDLTELERHYNELGAAQEYELWRPYWHFAESFLAEPIAAKTIGSLKATFDDQVDRWAAAEGEDLRQSIGAPDYSAVMSTDEDLGLPNFVDLLFEWGGRLRLGEGLIADGADLRDFRFGRNEFDPIEHFYDEALERYAAVADQEPPCSQEVEYAVRAFVRVVGEELSIEDRSGLLTTAIRGYLWRTVEDGPVDFLEPELSEAVERSLTEGDDRSPDEDRSVTLYYAAAQVIDDNVKTRLGSIGGLIQGARFYEKALVDTTSDFEEHGFTFDDETKRFAFRFGVSLADVERVLPARAE